MQNGGAFLYNYSMKNPRIVVALDSFKGGLTAAEACRAVADGLHQANPATRLTLKPMADGGEGTCETLLAAKPGGRWIEVEVTSPLPPQQVKAGFAWFPDDRTAVIEMATASGLPLLTESERNPLLTCTSGTGELLVAAAAAGAAEIVLAIGGSATVDGGTGAARALGWRFLDAAGRELPPGGGSLEQLEQIVPPPATCPALPPVTVLCDVTNPLCGPNGAAAVFGPQKGATPSMVAQLERGLQRLADVVEKQFAHDLCSLPGGGAAGGLGAGAVAFLNAALKPGIATILEATGFEESLQGADWCITGEGSFDSQSLQGKVVAGVAEAARRHRVPVVVFAGRVRAAPAEYLPHGIVAAIPTHAPEMPLEEVLLREYELLRATAADWLQTLDNHD